MGKRLRVGTHHGVSIVEHVDNADRGVMVASITAAPNRTFEDALQLAREICAAVNDAREARETGHSQGESGSDPGHVPGAARHAGEEQR